MSQPTYPQQPYAPQGYPQQPQAPAPYAPPAQPFVYGPPAQAAPQPQYAPQPYAGAYTQQSGGQPVYAPGYGQQPSVPQGPPPVAGTLAAFDAQPLGGGGAGLNFKTIGQGYACVVERDVTDRDVRQDTQPAQQGGAPKFYRDGRPQLIMLVPVLIQPDAEHPDGRGTLYVRSGVRDALAQAGLNGAPKAGDRFTIVLENKVQGNGTIPKNVFRATYEHANGGPLQPPAPAPEPPVQELPSQPAPQGFSTGQPQPYGQPAYPTAPQQPEQSLAPTQPQTVPASAPQPAAPVQAPPTAPVQGLPNLSPEQAAFLANLQAQQGGQA